MWHASGNEFTQRRKNSKTILRCQSLLLGSDSLDLDEMMSKRSDRLQSSFSVAI